MLPSVSRENAERAESESSGGKRDLDEQKGRLSIKLNGERTESGSSGGRRELDEAKGRLTVKLKLPKDFVKPPAAGAGLYLVPFELIIYQANLQCKFNRNWLTALGFVNVSQAIRLYCYSCK